ncbi:MAG: hypothetical protein ACI9LN_002813 [Saprospiraceae bacterium]
MIVQRSTAHFKYFGNGSFGYFLSIFYLFGGTFNNSR